jgi:hypothetical protein
MPLLQVLPHEHILLPTLSHEHISDRTLSGEHPHAVDRDDGSGSECEHEVVPRLRIREDRIHELEVEQRGDKQAPARPLNTAVKMIDAAIVPPKKGPSAHAPCGVSLARPVVLPGHSEPPHPLPTVAAEVPEPSEGPGEVAQPANSTTPMGGAARRDVGGSRTRPPHRARCLRAVRPCVPTPRQGSVGPTN